MGEQTKIEWCDHTFNPWRGCTKVSPGCANCYAERQARQNPAVLGEWGPDGKRAIAAESYWRLPEKWDKQALVWPLHEELCRQTGIKNPIMEWERRDGGRLPDPSLMRRPRVFVGSMMDVFEDRRDLDEQRRRLLNLIYQCRYLDWLLLTKRPQAMHDWIGGQSGVGWSDWANLYPHVWLGVSVENQQAADERLWQLRKCPAAVLFVSAEPLLGPLFNGGYCHDCGAHATIDGRCLCASKSRIAGWIVGGESGPHARPCNIAWIRSIVEQCKAAGVSCFVKQLGARPYTTNRLHVGGPRSLNGMFANWIAKWGTYLEQGQSEWYIPIGAPVDRKGGDQSEWPADLRVRELPEVRP